MNADVTVGVDVDARAPVFKYSRSLRANRNAGNLEAVIHNLADRFRMEDSA